MRIILTVVLLAAFTSFGIGPSFANSPCADELKNAKDTFGKVRQKALISQKKAMVQKIDDLMRKAQKAMESGEDDACHEHTKKIVLLSGKIH